MVESRAGLEQEIFHAVADLEPEARGARLAELCGDDRGLLRRVQALLGADGRGVRILDALERLLGGGPPRERARDPDDPYDLVDRMIGPYRVVGPLGGGGMGIVYRARDLDLNRDVALKFLPPAVSRDEEALQRFIREARAASALDHPAICTIHGIDRTPNGAVFIVMACYEGESVRERIARGSIPWREAVRIALQAAWGLERAHEAGIIHRDIKPGNLMLTQRGDVKILDFGIAKMMGDETVTGTGGLVGTAAYMSPEQVRELELDGRTDVWSLGVVLHEMVVGRRPFTGDHPLVVLHGILHKQNPRLVECAAEAPNELQAVLDRALAKDRDERYPSASDLAADLASLLAETPSGVAVASARTRARMHDLPTPLTSFVGREHEMTRVGSLLVSSRLVTLSGPAGTGKTRLAIETASRFGGELEDGAQFVALAPITDPELVASAVADAVGTKEGAGSPVEPLIEKLREREMLLVLDNFEQVLPAAGLVGQLLAACPRLRVLVTSRVVLRVSGEQEYRVPPLPLPDPDLPELADKLDEYPATALFLQRAASVDPDFSVGPEDARAIAEICERLDGLPLAIELAAARTRLLTPRAILDRLERRLELLSDGPRDLPARHRTLRQAIGWSYDLLEPRERTLFRRLSACNGGCTLEAAAVAHASSELDGPADSEILDTLAALVDRSLLRKGEGPVGTPRFWMLGTIREFGLEKLRESGEEPAVRRAHARYFLELAERAAPELTGPEQAEWTARLAADHDNLRAALDWVEANDEGELGLRLGAGLWRFWAIRGHLREGRQRLERLIAMPGAGEPTPARAAALSGLGTMIHESGDFRNARAPLEESLETFRALGDQLGIAGALTNLGWVAVWVSEAEEARSLNEEAAELNRELGQKRGLALALNNLGWLAQMHGDFATARHYHERSVTLCRELGDERGYARSLINRAWADRCQCRLDEAESDLEEAVSVLTRLGERQILGWGSYHLGCVALFRGQLSRATEILEESVETWRRSGNQSGVAWSTMALGESLLERNERDRAEELLREAMQLWRAMGSLREQACTGCVLARLLRLDGDRTAARKALSESLAYLRRVGDRFGLAGCLEELAALLGEMGDRSTVATLMGAAEALRDGIGAPLPPYRRDVWDSLAQRVRDELGDERFERAHSEGASLAAAQAIELAQRLLDVDEA